MEKCKQTSKHKCMFTISIFSSKCNYSMKRHQFFRLWSCAQNTDVDISGNSEKLHYWPKKKTITCTLDNFVPFVVPGLSSSFCSSSVSTSRPKDQSNSSGKSETSTDPMTTRRSSMRTGNRCRQTLICKHWEALDKHTKKKRDEQGRSNAKHSWLVAALYI